MSLTLLEPYQFDRARLLFAELAEMHLFATAVLNHDLPGLIAVDDLENPQSGFMSTRELQFLAGDPNNAVFNRALKLLLRQTICAGHSPEGRLEEIDLTFVGDSWQHRLEELFGDWRWPPIPDYACHYRLAEIRFDWRQRIPAGYTVVPLDADIIARQPADNYSFEVKPLSSFGAGDFGFCVVHSGHVVCTCTTDVISGDACEIGIETAPEHRRRGLAAITAVATVECAQSRGFQHIWWICNASNPGSIRTAEKVGFEKQFESNGYGFIIDATEHKRQADE